MILDVPTPFLPSVISFFQENHLRPKIVRLLEGLKIGVEKLLCKPQVHVSSPPHLKFKSETWWVICALNFRICARPRPSSFQINNGGAGNMLASAIWI